MLHPPTLFHHLFCSGTVFRTQSSWNNGCTVICNFDVFTTVDLLFLILKIMSRRFECIIVLWLKMPSDDLKFFTAIIVAVFLAVPYLKRQSKASFKKAGKRKVGLLSGGQRQAVTLLMASLQKPKVLLLDEHTAALNPKTSSKVLSLTDKIISENKLTAMMVTHNMRDAIAHGNRLIMMNNGKVILNISGEEFVSDIHL